MLVAKSLLERAAPEVARGLLGCFLVQPGVRLRLTEVEAYAGPEDSASHCRFGVTRRNAAMWGPPGRAYVYRCYGLHWMLNVVCGTEGEGAAVLLRGAEVVEGEAQVAARRGGRTGPATCRGPGNLAASLGVDGTRDGMDLCSPGWLELHAGPPPRHLLAGPRVGIDYASAEDRARLWRFAVLDSPSVTKRRQLVPERGTER